MKNAGYLTLISAQLMSPAIHTPYISGMGPSLEQSELTRLASYPNWSIFKAGLEQRLQHNGTTLWHLESRVNPCSCITYGALASVDSVCTLHVFQGYIIASADAAAPACGLTTAARMSYPVWPLIHTSDLAWRISQGQVLVCFVVAIIQSPSNVRRLARPERTHF